MTANDDPSPLRGRTIALPETRELDRLAGILEQEGATTLRCPLVAILDAPEPRPVDDWIDELVTRGFDDIIFLTGEGLRRLLARASLRGGEPAVAAMVEAVGRARKITRGPKPARALHEVKLKSDLAAVPPTSEGVMATLAGETLAGRRIGLQLYGSEPNQPLVRFLEGKGALVRTVAPYIYAPASDEDRVVQLIDHPGGGGHPAGGPAPGQGGGHRSGGALGARATRGDHRHHPRRAFHHEAYDGGHRGGPRALID
jgi:uroporphyrinogen-III synthase